MVAWLTAATRGADAGAVRDPNICVSPAEGCQRTSTSAPPQCRATEATMPSSPSSPASRGQVSLPSDLPCAGTGEWLPVSVTRPSMSMTSPHVLLRRLKTCPRRARRLALGLSCGQSPQHPLHYLETTLRLDRIQCSIVRWTTEFPVRHHGTDQPLTNPSDIVSFFLSRRNNQFSLSYNGTGRCPPDRSARRRDKRCGHTGTLYGRPGLRTA